MTHQEIKKTGKVKRINSGIYKYQGVNFDIEFALQECETKYWAIYEFTFKVKNQDMTEDQKDSASYFYQYDTKSDLVWNLKQIDYNI